MMKSFESPATSVEPTRPGTSNGPPSNNEGDSNSFNEWNVGGVNMALIKDLSKSPPRDNDPHLTSETSKPLPRTVGFMNVGNTCYVNAALQALFRTPSFKKWMEQDKHHKKYCNDRKNCTFCALSRVLKDISDFPDRSLSPSDITCRINLICPEFEVGAQQDGHDFLIRLLASVEDSLEKANMRIPFQDASTELKSISQLFGGSIRSTVSCANCGRKSMQNIPIGELELQINDSTSVQAAVGHYFKSETLHDYKCEKCGSCAKISKKITMLSPPKILCMYLKRFTGDGQKINRKIHSIKNLDLSEHLCPESHLKKLKYRMTTQIFHKGGTLNSGHYTATALGPDGHFHLFDDSSVTYLSEESALFNDIFVVMYELDEESCQPPAISLQNVERSSAYVSGTGSRAITMVPGSTLQIHLNIINPLRLNKEKLAKQDVHVTVNTPKNKSLGSTKTEKENTSFNGGQLFIEDLTQYDTSQKRTVSDLDERKAAVSETNREHAEHDTCPGTITSNVDTGQNGNISTGPETAPPDKTFNLFKLFFPKKSRRHSKQKPAKKPQGRHLAVTNNMKIADNQQEQQKSDRTCVNELHSDSKLHNNTFPKLNSNYVKKASSTESTEKENTRRSKRKIVTAYQYGNNEDTLTKNKDASDGVSGRQKKKTVAKSSVVSDTVPCGQNSNRTNDKADDNNADVAADTPFSCDVCIKLFPNGYSLRRHKKTVHLIRIPYKCCFCEQTFDTYQERATHRIKVHGRKPFKCTECAKSFSERDRLNKHLLTHGIKPIYSCLECPDKFNNSAELTSHVDANHAKDEKVTCKYCLKVMCKKNLKKHMQRIHSAEYLKEWWNEEKSKNMGLDVVRKHKRLKSTEDDVSGKSTARSYTNRSKNEQEVDSTSFSSSQSEFKKQNPKTNCVWFKCNYCMEYFNSIAERNAHEDTIHGTQAHVCNVCDRRFHRIANLHKHLKDVHKQKVPISCHLCDDVFSSNKEKQQHMKKIHGLKPYICSECSQGFSESCNLKRHLFRAHGFKPDYPCPQCPKYFLDAKELESHMALHKNGGIIKCDFCTQQLTLRSMLEHIRVKHPLELNFFLYKMKQKRKEKPKRISSRKNIAENVIIPDQDLKYTTADSFCSMCMKQFRNEYAYQSHMREHHRQKLKYKCEICDQVYDTILERKKHRKIVHGDRPFKCSSCTKNYKTNPALNVHIMACHNVLKLQCSKCSYKALTMEKLQDHHRRNHPAVLTEFCDYCPQKFKKRYVLYRHIRQCHPEVKLEFKGVRRVIPGQKKITVSERRQQFFIVHGHKEYKCKYCDKSFHGKYELQRHTEAVHIKKGVYFCNVCNEKFKHPFRLRQHRERVHNEGGHYKCSICQKEFGSMADLYNHMKQEHDDKRISKCPFCNKWFHQKVYVRSHIKRVHNPDNPYPCKLCKNAYLTCAALMSHFRLAHGVQQSFVCDECPSQFERFIQLIKHRRENHTMVQKHHCGNCGKGFNTSSQLNHHTTTGYCAHCTYLFENNEEKLRHFTMHHNNFIFNRMIIRQSHLMRNLKKNSLDQQREDFTEIYELSQELVPFCNEHRKLYGLVFVPSYVTKDTLKNYLNESANEMYFSVGKFSVGYRRYPVSRHHLQLSDCSATELRINSGFRCFHIFDVWIGEVSESKELGALDYIEALNILKLLLFAIYYNRKDIFMQKLELDPLFKVEKCVVDELIEDVIRSQGNVLRLSGFGFQFVQEIKTEKSINEKPDSAFTCNRCNSVHNLYTRSLRTRHEFTCNKRDWNKRARNRMELLLSIINLNVNEIVKVLALNGRKRFYCCYSITGIKKIRRSREAVLNYSGRAMKYHGQNSYGHVSQYHFNPDNPSTVRNLIKSGFRVYLTDLRFTDSEKIMFQVEIMLQIKEIIQSSNGSNTKLAYKHLKLYDVSVLFSLEQWLEILTWSREERSDSLPLFVNARHMPTFKNITAAIRKRQPLDNNDGEDDYDGKEDDYDEEEYLPIPASFKRKRIISSSSDEDNIQPTLQSTDLSNVASTPPPRIVLSLPLPTLTVTPQIDDEHSDEKHYLPLPDPQSRKRWSSSSSDENSTSNT